MSACRPACRPACRLAGQPACRPAGRLSWSTALLAAVLALLAGCAALEPPLRAVVYEPAGVKVQSFNCVAAMQAALNAGPATGNGALLLDPQAIRVVTWNIHKQSDAGWDTELARLAARNDLLLLQEVTLSAAVQDALRDARLSWILASSFMWDDTDVGVLTASRVLPVASCTQRSNEPLVRLPKSAVITWIRIAGSGETLAVANVHAINFIPTLDAYRAQFEVLAGILGAHRGPIVLAGDLNTWSDARFALVRDVAQRLGLTEVVPAGEDLRARFFGQQVDHVFVRGLAVTGTRVTAVKSSDHNPLEVVLRLVPP